MLTAATFSPGSGWVERRDSRHKVLIRARMRAGGLPVEICINNVSSRGICAMTAAPPPRGTYVELLDTAIPMVGKVVWSGNRRFGIAVQDKIDLPRLVAQNPGLGKPDFATRVAAHKHATAAQEQHSRATGQRFQFFVLGAAVLIAALLIGELVYSYLSHAADAVGVGLQS